MINFNETYQPAEGASGHFPIVATGPATLTPDHGHAGRSKTRGKIEVAGTATVYVTCAILNISTASEKWSRWGYRRGWNGYIDVPVGAGAVMRPEMIFTGVINDGPGERRTTGSVFITAHQHIGDGKARFFFTGAGRPG